VSGGGCAPQHPVAPVLAKWAQYGCLAWTGRDWALAEIEAAIQCGPDVLAPIEHFHKEVAAKVKSGQVRVVKWETFRHNPPR
jgi:hypothetical protein